MVSIEEWYRSLPYLTRGWLTTSFIVSLLVTFRVLSPATIALSWEPIISQLQVWRLVSNFFFFAALNDAMMMFLNFYMLVTYCRPMETNYHPGVRGAAELVFMTAFLAAALIALTLVFPLFILAQPLLTAIIYVWSRKDPHRPVVIYGFTFEQWHVPFVFVAVSFVLSGGALPIGVLAGIFVGHLWYFMTEVVPRVYGLVLLTVPQRLYDWFDVNYPRAQGEAPLNPRVQQQQQQPDWRRGAGHRLDQ